MDNHGVVSTNPAIVYVMVKHNPNSSIGLTGNSNPPGTTMIQPQEQQHQAVVPNTNGFNAHSPTNSLTSPASRP
jgi:hypothetical protein